MKKLMVFCCFILLLVGCSDQKQNDSYIKLAQDLTNIRFTNSSLESLQKQYDKHREQIADGLYSNIFDVIKNPQSAAIPVYPGIKTVKYTPFDAIAVERDDKTVVFTMGTVEFSYLADGEEADGNGNITPADNDADEPPAVERVIIRYTFKDGKLINYEFM